jgi:O-antigen ligase
MRKKRKTESVSESISLALDVILRVLVGVYIVLILGVLPFYNQQGFTHIGTDKSSFFRTCSVRMAWLILPVLAARLLWGLFVSKAGRKLSVTDVFAALFGVSVILSYLGSSYKETALWGTSGWYMGLIPQLIFVSIYFLTSRYQIFSGKMIYLLLPVSAVTFVLGYLNRFDIWPLAMENSGRAMFISTIGNINWYCGYIVAVLFVGVGLLWLENGEKRWYTLLLSCYVFLGFAALTTQGSDSGMFALAVVLMVLFVLSAKDGDERRMQRFWLIVLLLAGACLMTWGLRYLFPLRLNYSSGIGGALTANPLRGVGFFAAAVCLWVIVRIFGKRMSGIWKAAAKGLCVLLPVALAVFVAMIALNTRNPGCLGKLSDKSIFTFNLKWGSNRGATWTVGLRCFAEQNVFHKLVGIGPDCMADFLYQDGSEALLATVKAAFEKRLTNAHCELLTLLVNTGLLGAVCFAGMMASAIRRMLKVRGQNIFAAACGLCVLAYAANNLWSFQQSMSTPTIFVVLGFGEYYLRNRARS